VLHLKSREAQSRLVRKRLLKLSEEKKGGVHLLITQWNLRPLCRLEGEEDP